MTVFTVYHYICDKYNLLITRMWYRIQRSGYLVRKQDILIIEYKEIDKNKRMADVYIIIIYCFGIWLGHPYELHIYAI